MVREICPRCNRVYVREEFNTDFIHQCDSGIEALDNEDIVVVGDYETVGGTTTISASTKSQMMKSTVNKLFGTKASVYGDAEDVEDRTTRGKRKSTHATRQHFEYIDKSKDEQEFC